jgi:hypothetical protein
MPIKNPSVSTTAHQAKDKTYNLHKMYLLCDLQSVVDALSQASR